MIGPVTIRVWDGPTVRGVIHFSNGGSAWSGAVGGAENSTKVHIELDPWAGLIVDHRAEWAEPVSIRVTGD